MRRSRIGVALKPARKAPGRGAFIRLVATGVVAVASLSGGASAAAADAASPAELEAQVEAGRKTYTAYCTRCHGIRLASTGLGFDLRTFPREEKARFVRVVSTGLRAMPAWGGVLKPEDIDAIWAYMGSVNGWDAAAPAAK